MAIIGVCLAYYFIRRYAKRLGKPGPKVRYKPMRDETDDQPGDGGGDAGGTAEDENGSVDPMLAAAAEEYQRERQDRDAEDHG